MKDAFKYAVSPHQLGRRFWPNSGSGSILMIGLRPRSLEKSPSGAARPEPFASGLSWKGTLGGKEVYCPPPGLKGGQVMTTLDQFLASNPDKAEKSYGDAMAASLSRAFPRQPQ